jgi:hypothetical protein
MRGSLSFTYAACSITAFSLACAERPVHSPWPSRPSEGEFVLDQAHLIPPDSLERMNDLLGALLREIDVEILVLSMPLLEGTEIQFFTQEIFEEWKIGDATKANRGLLLVVAAQEQRVRLAVSYELESIFTDSYVSHIEHNQLEPYFEGNMVGEGIEATVELLARRAYQGIREQTYDPDQARPTIGRFRAGGAGVESSVVLDGRSVTQAPPVDASQQEYFGPQPTPEDAWARFLEINRRRIQDPSLGIYDEPTRDHLRTRPHTNAGQQHIVELYDGRSATIRRQDDRAVVLFPGDDQHLLAPWFFHHGPEGWQLDGAILPQIIGYNHRNQWRFKALDHEYMFAFTDYRIDENGFAFPRNE